MYLWISGRQYYVNSFRLYSMEQVQVLRLIGDSDKR